MIKIIEVCPVCHSPLLENDGKYYCPQCCKTLEDIFKLWGDLLEAEV